MHILAHGFRAPARCRLLCRSVADRLRATARHQLRDFAGGIGNPSKPRRQHQWLYRRRPNSTDGLAINSRIQRARFDLSATITRCATYGARGPARNRTAKLSDAAAHRGGRTLRGRQRIPPPCRRLHAPEQHYELHLWRRIHAMPLSTGGLA